MDDEKSKLERRKLQYEIWNIDSTLDLHTLNHLSRIIHSNYNMLDKNLLYISSGALALSIPLISQLPNIHISTLGKITLILAWCFFGLTIITTLISFNVSTDILAKLQLERWEMYVKSRKFHLSGDVLDDNLLFQSIDHLLETKPGDIDDGGAIILGGHVINQFSIFNFVAAIICLSVFLIKAVLNI